MAKEIDPNKGIKKPAIEKPIIKKVTNTNISEDGEKTQKANKGEPSAKDKKLPLPPCEPFCPPNCLPIDPPWCPPKSPCRPQQ